GARQLDGEIFRLGAAQDPIHIPREAPVEIAQIGSVVEEQAALRERWPPGNGGQLRFGREPGQPFSVDEHRVVRKDHHGVAALLPHGGERLLDLGNLANWKIGDGDTELLRRLFRSRALTMLARMLRSGEDGDAPYVR